MKYRFLFILLFSIRLLSQTDSNTVLTFDFNDHEIKGNSNNSSLRYSDISLDDDRFGNAESAIYLHGEHSSYLSLGTSAILKPKRGSISLWVKLDRKVYAGKGYESNPIFATRNSAAEDFCDAYNLFYDLSSERFMIFSSKDSTEQSGVNSVKKVEFGKWYHLAFTYDSVHIALYVNGILQLKAQKKFETFFNPLDSVMVGNSGDKKNDRYMRGSIDDIQIFHKILSEKEIQNLFNAPNPNKLRKRLTEASKLFFVILLFLIALFIVVLLNKRKLKRQKEYYELQNKINELEIKVIKGQINPHFISNCLAAIQNLIYQNEPDIASQYIAKFNRLMRIVLNASDKAFIYLSEELEIIKLNIELEQLRFKHEFQYQFSIRENINTGELLIPSLITQPIIENAIWHGLLPLHGKRAAWLNIHVFYENEYLIIEIVDNGVGRSKRSENGQSKGTKLVLDKLQSVNKISNSDDNKLVIIDLFDNRNSPMGTQVKIQLQRKIE